MKNEIFNGDCLEIMQKIPDKSIGLILTDLPYGGGTTDCAWDKRIDLPSFWKQARRILASQSSAVLFASGKFTHILIESNFEQFKYKWVWVKNAATNFVHAKNAPMRKYEEIVVFSDGVVQHDTLTNNRMKYFPQGITRPAEIKTRTRHSPSEDGVYRHGALKGRYAVEATNYPSDVIFFNSVFNNEKLHPSQKPVELLEFLINTYTIENEIVLDATMGSGSTCVAAINTGRNFIGIEKDERYFEIAQKRIQQAQDLKAQELFNQRWGNDKSDI